MQILEKLHAASIQLLRGGPMLKEITSPPTFPVPLVLNAHCHEWGESVFFLESERLPCPKFAHRDYDLDPFDR